METITSSENKVLKDEPDRILVRVHMVTLKEKRAIDAPLDIPIWYMKKTLCARVLDGEEKDIQNFGFYLSSSPNFVDKRGKWLRESLRLSSYIKKPLNENNSEIEILFIPKARFICEEDVLRYASKNINKHRKKFMNCVSKGLVADVTNYCQKGLDPNFKDDNGYIPLMVATVNEDTDMITALIQGGAFIDYRLDTKNNYASALHVAVNKGKMKSLERLIKLGAWIDLEDIYERTPLFYAVLNGEPELLTIILSKRPEINHKDSRGWTALHLACAKKNEICALILIDSGANMNIKNNVGNTPLHLAVANNAEYCVDYLIIRGCSRYELNKSGQSALQIATMGGSAHIKKKLANFKDNFVVPPPPLPIYDGNNIIVSPENNVSIPIKIDKELIYNSVIHTAYFDNPSSIHSRFSSCSLNKNDNCSKNLASLSPNATPKRDVIHSLSEICSCDENFDTFTHHSSKNVQDDLVSIIPFPPTTVPPKDILPVNKV